ncbi:hypothetical protein FA15DRAFT_678128 [Coprinopsis marcescibilis]|uniref:Uncharacterized protein n=1 Tax=Coprinopsis marcescibilis TaxID=230819 RepID=A0A5C3L8H2_COPMA|nr:hypothetical protein FA15DRAFT_678128 [Coprinopsis marcescibilis]
MPSKGKRSENAKRQWETGGSMFGTGLLDDDPIEKQLDPDYMPESEDNISDEEEVLSGNYVFLLAEGSQDDEEEMRDGENNADSEGDSDREVLTEEKAAINYFHKFKVEPSSPAPEKKPKLSALPTYSGAGKTSVYVKGKALKKAAVGCKTIDSFFSRANSTQSEVPPEANGPHEAGLSVPENCTNDTDPPLRVCVETPTHELDNLVLATCEQPSGSAEPPAPTDQPTDNTDTRNANAEPPATAANASTNATDNESIAIEELLNISVEWDDIAETRPPLHVVLMRLLQLMKKHKSYSALLKLESVKNYLWLKADYTQNPWVRNPATRASLAVARAIGKGPAFAWKIRELMLYIDRFHTLPPSKAGKHHAHPSLLNNEQVFHTVRKFLTVQCAGEVTPRKLADEVNNVIIPNIGLDLGGQKITERCAVRWLHKLGYKLSQVKKGMYIDGHERKDVVKSPCDTCLMTPRLRQLKHGECMHVPIFQDESAFRSNDLQPTAWTKDGEMPLWKKGGGRMVHVSDFIVELTGHLKLSPELIDAQKGLPPEQQVPEHARVIIYPGKNGDAWWDAKQLIDQVKTRAIPIFEKLYPGAVAEFFFDQLTAHSAFGPNGLRMADMNVRPGGKQPKMHNTKIPNNNLNPELCGKPQTMVFDENLPEDHPFYEFCGQPKGMRQVLEERGLWDLLTARNGGKAIPGTCKMCSLSIKEQEKRAKEVAKAMAGIEEPKEADPDDSDDSGDDTDSLTGPTCCMRKPLLQLVIEEAGHKCYFLPKFHCELNPIEMHWGWAKCMRYRAVADGTWQKAKQIIPEILDSCTPKLIRAFFRKTWRYMDAYHKGLNAKQAEHAVRKYKSHRRVGAHVMGSVDMILN